MLAGRRAQFPIADQARDEDDLISLLLIFVSKMQHIAFKIAAGAQSREKHMIWHQHCLISVIFSNP
jgi:hypothetical protein